MLTETDRRFLRIAYEEAKASFDEGGCPIGSVLARGDAADREAAMRLARQVVEAGRSAGFRSSVTRGLHTLAKLHAANGDIDEAISHERDAVRLGRAVVPDGL